MTSHPPTIERVRHRFERNQHVHALPEAIFPLLCPVREYDWIPEWDCRLIYTESGLAEPGCIFQTDRDADGGLDTWVVSHHEPHHHIAFVRINALRVMQYDIRIEPADERSSRLRWTQVVTAINDRGDRHVSALQESDFTRTVSKLETLLNDYLARSSSTQA